MIVRLAIVVALLLAFALAKHRYARWQSGLHHETREHPRVPEALLAGAERTWIVFTTPYCGSCGPVEARLRAHDPAANVVKVDATRDPALADAFHVRSAPTVLLADAGGQVLHRLVGPASVESFVAAGA